MLSSLKNILSRINKKSNQLFKNDVNKIPEISQIGARGSSLGFLWNLSGISRDKSKNGSLVLDSVLQFKQRTWNKNVRLMTI